MPELPEMQALAERLHDLYAGATLIRVDLKQFSALKTVQPSPLDLHDHELVEVGRRGKYLIFDFDSARAVTHLSQGGRVDVESPPKETKPRGSVVRFFFEGRGSMLIKEFGTERKASLWVLPPDELGPLEGLGPEPFSNEFAELIATGDDRRRIHTLLRDQRFVAGIGRGFSDDILHHARLSPFDSLKSLTPEQREGLIASTKAVLVDALERERERTGGLPAKMRDRFVVHNHRGQACPRCGETLQRISYESHEVTYCPACQTNGKVLADRRLSRLLK